MLFEVHEARRTLYAYEDTVVIFNITLLIPHINFPLSPPSLELFSKPPKTLSNSSSLIDHVYLNEPESLEYCKVTPPHDSSVT